MLSVRCLCAVVYFPHTPPFMPALTLDIHNCCLAPLQHMDNVGGKGAVNEHDLPGAA